ncbi:MAG: hypothetical protein IT488_14260 [Gammaproteobacteria bacterium]|nr:hypothetical protein [Gammaproteobacteria bacterium]
MKRHPLRLLPLILGGMLFVWQLCLVYHQTEHGLSEPEEICLLCQVADHMQHGLSPALFPSANLPAFILPLANLSSQYTHPSRGPSARSPPAGSPV